MYVFPLWKLFGFGCVGWAWVLLLFSLLFCCTTCVVLVVAGFVGLRFWGGSGKFAFYRCTIPNSPLKVVWVWVGGLGIGFTIVFPVVLL